MVSLIWYFAYMRVSSDLAIFTALGHGIFWLLGLAIITMGGWRQIQAEDNLRKSNEHITKEIFESKQARTYLNNIIESIEVGLIVVDHEYKMQFANKAFCEKFHIPVEEVVGKHCYTVSHHIDEPCYGVGEECALKTVFETGRSHSVIHTHYDKENSPIYVDIKAFPIKDETGKVISVIEMSNDITEQKGLELKSRHSQKTDSVRQLAGGVAHGFNNILSVIVNYANLMLMKMTDESQKNNLQHILSSADRAISLTSKLLAFSKKQALDPKQVGLNGIINNVAKTVSEAVGENINVKTVLSDEDLIILADSKQLDQVLLHLAENARDAMPNGGELIIETKGVDIDDSFIRLHGYGEPGRYAILSVNDSGQGMDKATVDRIFEPFFSTKESAAGGLTLAIIKSIIEQHDGYIDVYSEPFIGTNFKIFLPLIMEKVQGKKVEEVKHEKPAIAKDGTETLLLAENDDLVREGTKYVLEEFGYRVIEAVDGEDAIEKFRENKADIRLLLLDVIMPKKNGMDAYNEILKESPGIRALFQSGHSVDFIKEKEMFVEGVEYILKPISPNELIKKIREELDK